jgi:hypothetical protein
VTGDAAASVTKEPDEALVPDDIDIDAFLSMVHDSVETAAEPNAVALANHAAFPQPLK